MSYDGPTQSDYANVHALNREFLRIARSKPAEAGLSDTLGKRLGALGRHQIERLATVPFLLHTICEQDLHLWRCLLQGNPAGDLFDADSKPDTETCNLIATTVGFLWQLAQRNPYAVRLISAAQSDWCELVVEMTYFELVSTSRQRGDLLTPRLGNRADLWNKLLLEGTRPESDVRTAAHMAALQELLTCTPMDECASWPVAACGSKLPHLRVAEYSGVRNRG